METKKQIHPAMARLYSASVLLKKIVGNNPQSEFANWLNISPQSVNNWEKRGPSKEIRIRCQNEHGINATWVETGEGESLLGNDARSGVATDLISVDSQIPGFDYDHIKAVLTGVLGAYGIDYADLVTDEFSAKQNIVAKLSRSSNSKDVSDQAELSADYPGNHKRLPGEAEDSAAWLAKKNPQKRAQGGQ